MESGIDLEHSHSYLEETNSKGIAENKAIKYNTYRGPMMKDLLTISLNGAEKMLHSADIFKVDDMTKAITDNNAEGVLGLLPSDDNFSLLQNMVNMKEITNRVFSLYIKLDSLESVIKFGGYDKNGIEAGYPYLKIVSDRDDMWRFSLTSIQAAWVEFPDTELDVMSGEDVPIPRFGIFNPAFPWIYLPRATFTQFATQFK